MNSFGLGAWPCLRIPDRRACGFAHVKGAARVSYRDSIAQLEAQKGEATVSTSTPSTSTPKRTIDIQPGWEKASSNATSSFLLNSDDNQGALNVKLENVKKQYETRRGKVNAVTGVSLEIPSGSIVALLGPSGSGKTTVLRMIAGLEDVTDGSVYFDGEEVTDTPVQDRELGMVFQSYALFNHMTIAENISFGLRMRKLPLDHERRVTELLDIVGLPGIGQRYPSQVSGGQRQRIALARALACSPRLLLLDEPFGALDALVRRQLRASMKTIIQSLGLTTILVTHDQEEAFDLADEVIVFNKGAVEQIGTADEVQDSPKNVFVLNFVGETQSVPSNSQFIRRMKFKTEEPKVMFRPQHIEFFRESREGLAPVTISDVRDVGYRIVYRIKFDDDQELTVPCSCEDYEDDIKKFEVEQRLYVKVDHEHLMPFHPSQISTIGST